MDLRIRYDENLEYYVRQWLTECIDHFNDFKDIFNASNDLHGCTLDDSAMALILADFQSFKKSINQSIENKVKKQPSYIKDAIATSVYNFWESLSSAWNKFHKAYIHGKSKEVTFPTRYNSLDGILEFIQITTDGVDQTIERIKDELYVTYGSAQDKEFVEEVQELADHYNRVTAKLRQLDRLYGFHVLFSINENSEVEPRVDNLRVYQSLLKPAEVLAN